MANLNFPDPSVTQTYIEAGITWTWNPILNVWSTANTIEEPGDGMLTISTFDGFPLGTFTANQDTPSDITLPAPVVPGDGTLTIKTSTGASLGTFTANQTGPTNVTLPAAVVPGNGVLTVKDSDGNSLGTFSANQTGPSEIQLPEVVVPDSNSVTISETAPNSPSEGDLWWADTTVDNGGGRLYVWTGDEWVDTSLVSGGDEVFDSLVTINQGGVQKGTFTLNQSGPATIELDAGSTGGGFSGDYNDLTNKPTIGNARIIINQGGTQKGTFTTNQDGGDYTIDLDAGGGTGGGGLTGADSPLAVNGSNVKLNFGSGLRDDSGTLKVDIDTNTLKFNGNQLSAIQRTNEVYTFEPQAKQVSNVRTVKWGGAGNDTPGERDTISFDLPSDCNGFLSIVTWKTKHMPNQDTSYPITGDPVVNRVEGEMYCEVSGRSASCQTSNTSNKVALIFGNLVTHGGGGSSNTSAWRNTQYGVRVDEWNCNTGNGSINCTFGIRDVQHNKVQMEFNGGSRMAIIPFRK